MPRPSPTPCPLPDPCQDGPRAPVSPCSVQATVRAQGAVVPDPAPLPLPGCAMSPSYHWTGQAASPPSPGAQLAPGPAPAPLSCSSTEGGMPTPQGILLPGVLRPSTRVMTPTGGRAQCRQQRGSGSPCTPQSCPSPASCRSWCWLPRDLLGQDLLLPDKPAGGTSSASRGAARQLLPPTNRKPHAATLPRSHHWVHAAVSRAASPCPLPGSLWQHWVSR